MRYKNNLLLNNVACDYYIINYHLEENCVRIYIPEFDYIQFCYCNKKDIEETIKIEGKCIYKYYGSINENTYELTIIFE